MLPLSHEDKETVSKDNQRQQHKHIASQVGL